MAGRTMRWEQMRTADRLKDCDSAHGWRSEYQSLYSTVQRPPATVRYVPPKSEAQRIAYSALAAYTGTSRFVRDLQAKARASTRWRPTEKQAAVVLRIAQEESQRCPS